MSKQLKRLHCIGSIGTSLGIAALLAVLLAGCQQAQPPSSVAKDVATAEQRQAAKTDRELQHASDDVAKAQERVDEKAVDRNNVAAQDAYKVATARADGDHDVALQRCKALSGDAQRRCKQQADADYDATKANAKALEVSRTR